jgi:voltage-gated potassium channel Kch
LGAEQSALSVLASVGVISIIISSIAFTYSKQLYRLLGPFVKFFEHRTKVHFLEVKPEVEEMTDHVVIIGAHRMGTPVIKFLQKEQITFCVIDLNPHLVQELTQNNVTAFYGDAGDPEILDLVKLDKAKLIISTSQDMTDNEIILKEARHRRTKAILVMRALDNEHAKALADLGADFVITPETLSGDFLVAKIKESWLKHKTG